MADLIDSWVSKLYKSPSNKAKSGYVSLINDLTMSNLPCIHPHIRIFIFKFNKNGVILTF